MPKMPSAFGWIVAKDHQFFHAIQMFKINVALLWFHNHWNLQ
jgi:hypothetical protein